MNSPTSVGTLLLEVQPERVRWLWPGRIPLGKITILDGDPGLGKSLITLDIAARVSCGKLMPDGAQGANGGVILVGAEDGLADTIRPRLEAAGADLRRIMDLTLPNGKLFQVAEHVTLLEQAIHHVHAVMVVIDPIMAFLPPKKNSNNDQEVRQALTPLVKLAEKTGVAIILIRHMSKDETRENALYRGGGSIAFIGIARAGFVVAKSKNHQPSCVLAMAKSNLAPMAPSLLYEIREAEASITVEWLGTSDEIADELITASGATRKRDQAIQFISRQLAPGKLPSKELDEHARAAGFSPKTIQRARSELGVVSHQTPQGWVCELPKPGGVGSEGQMVTESDITYGHA
jgi:RecA-family ATPase